MSEPWNEKYRPKKIEDVVDPPPQVVAIIEKGSVDFPHLLFGGPPGVGKTTLAHVLIREFKAEWLELNASKERGIDTVRDKISLFARKDSSASIKILLLDEADKITPHAQGALRRIMELYSDSCKFILTVNNMTRIVPAIKSRCSTFTFSWPDRDKFLQRMKRICKVEGIDPEKNRKEIKKLVEMFYPDFRKVINEIQVASIRGKLDLSKLDENVDYSEAVWGAVERKDWAGLYKLTCSGIEDLSITMSYIFKKLSDEKDLDGVIIVADYMYRSAFVADPVVNFMAMAAELISGKEKEEK